MPFADHRIAYAAFVAAMCGYALVRGGWPERAGVAVCVSGSLLSVLAQSTAAAPYREAMPGVLSVDLLVGAAFLAIGVLGRRFWPVWSLAFTLAGIFAHVARETTLHVAAIRYFHVAGLWAYPAMLAMAIGTSLEARNQN